MKKVLAVTLLLALSAVLVLGCSTAEQATQPEPVAPQVETEAVVEEAPVAAPDEVEAEMATEEKVEVASPEVVEAVEEDVAEPEDVQVEAEPEVVPEEAEEVVEVEPAVETEPVVEEAQADTPAEDVMEEVAKADESSETEMVDEAPVADATTPEEEVVEEPAIAETDEADANEEMEAVPFTASVGLDTFSAYKLDVDVTFEGTKAGKVTAGDMVGLFETTHGPEAQHWMIQMTGDVLPELAMLGGKVELYDIGGTMYMQNPGDGTWIGVPGFLVQGMMPSEIYSPEDSIELPLTAIPQPGEEEVNGIVTQRYTFGADDLASDSSNYENVEGTIWVAVDGNYVVKYEAEITGDHSGLTAGDVKLLDEGTITMAYDLTDVNGDFVIGPPAGAQAIDLAGLLFQ